MSASSNYERDRRLDEYIARLPNGMSILYDGGRSTDELRPSVRS